MLREMAYAKKKQKASWLNDGFFTVSQLGRFFAVVVVVEDGGLVIHAP